MSRGADETDLHWTIVWKDVWVRRQYKVTDELGYTQGPETLTQSMRVVDRVVVPDPYNQGERAYVFGSNVPAAPPPAGSYTQGWGELNSVTLPAGPPPPTSGAWTGRSP
jgi:hypothetical protein